MASSSSSLTFKVLAETASATAGLKRFASSLTGVQKSADKTNASLGKIGSKKATLSVNDKAIQRAKTEIGRLQDQMGKDLALDVNADTTQAQRRIRQLQASIKSLQRSKITPEVNTSKLSKVKTALADVGGSLKSFGAGVGNVFKSVGVPVLGAIGVAAAGVATSIGAIGVKSLQLADDLDNAKISFTKFLGSADKANAFLGDLEKLAAKTPFEFPELIESSKKLLAFGVSGNDVVGIMTLLGDAAALTGNSVEDLAVIYGQMVAKGKVSNEELLQLTERGVPGYQILADAMGKTVGEVEKLASEGKLGAEALDDLMTGIDKGFGGGMAKQAETLGGMISTLKDTFNGILRDIGTAILPIAKNVLPGLQAGAEGIGDKITAGLPKIVDAVAAAAQALLTLPGIALRALAGVAQGFAGMVSGIQTTLARLVTGIADALDSLPAIFGDIDTTGLRDASLGLAQASIETNRVGKQSFDGLNTAADKADAAVAPLAKKIEAARLQAQAGIKLQADTAVLDQKLTKVDADLKRFRANRANPKLDADKTYWDRKIKQAEAEKKRLEQKKINIKFDANAAPLKKKLADANTQLASLRKKKATPEVNAKIEQFKRKRAEAIRGLATLNVRKANPKLDANSAAFKRKVAEAERKIKAADKLKAEAAITANDNTAAGVNSAKRNLNSVNDKTVTITTVRKSKGTTADIGPQAQMLPPTPPPVLVPAPVVNVTPQITIHLRDERLADLIDVRVDGRAARAAHVVSRRRAVLL